MFVCPSEATSVLLRPGPTHGWCFVWPRRMQNCSFISFYEYSSGLGLGRTCIFFSLIEYKCLRKYCRLYVTQPSFPCAYVFPSGFPASSHLSKKLQIFGLSIPNWRECVSIQEAVQPLCLFHHHSDQHLLLMMDE